MKLSILAIAATFATATIGRTDDKPTTDPKNTPLELKITGKTKYTLTPNLSGPEAAKRIQNAVKAGGRPPAAPAVELTVVIKNTSDKPVSVWVKGDSVTLDLELKGKGAVNVAPRLAFTTDFRLPMAVEIGPGKAHELPVKALVSGFRGASKFSYWTAPGEYELVAKLKTGMQPAPKGAKDFDGFGVVTLTGAPLKITVEETK